MEINRRKTEEEFQRQKNEINAAHQKTKQELQQQRAKMELDLQEKKEDLERERKQIETAQRKMDEEIQQQKAHLMMEQNRVQVQPAVAEKQCREPVGEKQSLQALVEKLREEKMKIETDCQLLENALAVEFEYREREEKRNCNILQIRREVPNYWGINALDEPYREIEINPTSHEFQILQSLMNETIEVHDAKHGTIYEKDPTEFIVTKVTRIYNRNLRQHYCFTKVKMIQTSINRFSFYFRKVLLRRITIN